MAIDFGTAGGVFRRRNANLRRSGYSGFRLGLDDPNEESDLFGGTSPFETKKKEGEAPGAADLKLKDNFSVDNNGLFTETNEGGGRTFYDAAGEQFGISGSKVLGGEGTGQGIDGGGNLRSFRGGQEGGTNAGLSAPSGGGYLGLGQMDASGTKDLRGYACGGMVSHKAKFKQPGYAKGGKIKLPPEMPGPIGDVEQDMGQDTQKVAVRPGEYLLNPETVAFFGEGNYEAGVRNLNQIVEQATGQPPGPEMVDEEMMGFARGGGTFSVFDPESYKYFMDNQGKNQMAVRTGQGYTPIGSHLPNEGPIRVRPTVSMPGPEVGPQKPVTRVAPAKATAQGTAYVDEQVRRAKDGFGKPKPEAPKPEAPKADAPKAKTGSGGKWFGTADDWRDWRAGVGETADKFKGRQQGSFSLRDPAQYGKAVKGAGRVLGAVAAPLAVGTGVFDATTGIMEGDPIKAGIGALDTAAGVGLATPAAPVAGLYLTGRGAYEGGKQYYKNNATEILDTGENAFGGHLRNMADFTAAQLNRINPNWGMSEAEQARLREMRYKFDSAPDIVGAPAPVPAPVSAAQAEAEAKAKAAAASAPYGRAFGAGNVTLPTNGLRSASEAVAPGGMNVVQRTGGPNDEVIIREDVNGVPTFTNLRQGGFKGDAATLQAEADARVADDYATGLRNEKVVEQMRQNAPAYTNEAAEQRRVEAQAMKLAEIEAAGRGGATEPLDLRKELEQQFQRPKLNDDGEVTGYMPDPDKIKVFESIISQLNPAIEAEYGAPFHELPLEERQNVYREYDGVLNDTIAGQRAERNSGRPTSRVPRTGDRGLRVVPGSDISPGDVWGPEFTMGDYWAGAFDDSDINDLQVEDYSGARMPLRRLLKQNKGAEREALERYGYFDQQKPK